MTTPHYRGRGWVRGLVLLALLATLAGVSANAASAAAKASTSQTHTAGPASVSRATDNIADCAVVITGLGLTYATGGAGWAVWAALSGSGATAPGCGAWMASAICRGTYFWGPFGYPFRQAVKHVTRGRYSNC